MVRMDDGVVTFKGGSISNSTAVRACAERESRVPRAVGWYVARCSTADRWRARRMLRRVVYGVRRMRPAWSVLCMLHHHCRIDACCIGASAHAACCVGARCMLFTPVYFASARVPCCLGARNTLHCRRTAVPQRLLLCDALLVRCACAARSDEGRAVTVAERRRDALVRRLMAAAAAACSPWTRAPRCSTPWRYPAPKQRYERVEPDAQLGRVSADGVHRPIALGVAAPAYAQDYGYGGVVRMEDGAVTFKGGSISNSTAVRACARRESRVPRAVGWYVARCGTADGWRARRMLRPVVCGVRRMRPAWSVLCMLHHHCCIDACCIGASARVASVRAACCVGACCVLHRRVLHVACCKRAAVPQRTVVQSVVWCLVRVRCPIGRRPGCCGCRAAARCARAQINGGGGGGVLSMTKGTALFDAVAISGTGAAVRASRAGCAVGAGVGGRGASADCIGRGCAGLCAGLRRRGAHGGWRRHVQGRLDLEQHGGACVCPARVARPARRGMVCCAVRHGRWMARTAHAAVSGVRCTAHAAGVERLRTPF